MSYALLIFLIWSTGLRWVFFVFMRYIQKYMIFYDLSLDITPLDFSPDMPESFIPYGKTRLSACRHEANTVSLTVFCPAFWKAGCLPPE